MDYRLEPEVWAQAEQRMSPDAFAALIRRTLQSYKRLPGHTPLERVHASNIGNTGLEILCRELLILGMLHHGDKMDGYISLRAALRAHLYISLQGCVVSSCNAPGALIDDHMARDLGL